MSWPDSASCPPSTTITESDPNATTTLQLVVEIRKRVLLSGVTESPDCACNCQGKARARPPIKELPRNRRLGEEGIFVGSFLVIIFNTLGGFVCMFLFINFQEITAIDVGQ
jgi:hypothetical protein